MTVTPSEFKHISLVLHGPLLLSHHPEFPYLLDSRDNHQPGSSCSRKEAHCKKSWDAADLPPAAMAAPGAKQLLRSEPTWMHTEFLGWRFHLLLKHCSSPCFQGHAEVQWASLELCSPSVVTKGLWQGRTQRWLCWILAGRANSKEPNLWLNAREEIHVNWKAAQVKWNSQRLNNTAQGWA